MLLCKKVRRWATNFSQGCNQLPKLRQTSPRLQPTPLQACNPRGLPHLQECSVRIPSLIRESALDNRPPSAMNSRSPGCLDISTSGQLASILHADTHQPCQRRQLKQGAVLFCLHSPALFPSTAFLVSFHRLFCYRRSRLQIPTYRHTDVPSTSAFLPTD